MRDHRSDLSSPPDFQVLFEAAPSLLIVLAPDAPHFTITGASDALLRATGTERAAILGRGLFEVFPDNPDDPGADGVRNLRASLERVLATAAPDRMPVQKYDVRRPDGRFVERHWKPVNTPVIGPGGRVSHIIHQVEDVTASATELRGAAEALRASEARSRDVLERMAEGYVLLDRDFRVLDINAEGLRIDGRPRKAIVGRHLLEAWPESERLPVWPMYRRAMAERAPGEVTFRRPSDAHDVWLEVRAHPSGDGLAVFYRDVSGRKRAEEALRESEGRYRSLFNSIDAGFCVVEVRFDEAEHPLDYRLLEVNPAFERQTGLVGAAGRWVRELAPTLEQHWFDTYGRVALTGEPARFENRAEPLGDRWFDVYAFRVGAPEARRVAILFTDVSARRRAEEARRLSEERLRLVVETATDYAILTLDTERRVTSWSAGAAAAFGYAADEIEGRPADILFTPEDRAAGRPEHEIETARREGYAPDVRWHLRKDGSRVFVNGVVRPLRDGAGAALGFLKVGRDETERRRTEEVLAESEARFRNMADHAPVMMWVTKPSGACTYLNRRWYEFTGQNAAEAEGFGWLDATHPEDKGRAGDVFLAANARREPFQLEYRLRRADGTYRWAIDAASPRFGPDGEFLGYIGSVIDIGDRREAEERLRESEDRYRHTVELNPQVTWTARADGQLDQVSPNWLGWTGTTGLGATWAEGLHPDDRPHTFAAWGRSVETGEPYDVEHRVAMRDGGYFWARSRAYPRRDDGGRIVKWYGTTEDVHKRKVAEAALAESEGKFRAITNSIDQMIWSTRPDGFHDFFNRRWYDYTGVPEGSTDGEEWNGMFHPDDRERARATWNRSLETGEPYRIEYRLRHRSGQYRWVLGRAQAVRDGAGRITRWFGTCTDIQEIVEAREVLARSRESLEREIRDRTAERDRIWALSQDLLGVADAEGRWVSVNPAWERVLGWAEADILGRTSEWLEHPDDQERTRAEIASLAVGGRTLAFENRFRARDGSYRWLSWTAVPEEGLLYTTARDVSAEKERRAELEQAQEALRQAQKMEAVGQLTGGVAHDFNNLLTIIRSSTDLLRRPDLPETRRRRYVDAIADTVDRAAKLTGQLLAFARRQALKPEVFDAAERVRGVADMLRTIMGSRVRIETDIACESCLVEADASQFETALVNMAVNARDAMEGEGTLTVRVEGVSAMPPIRGHARGAGPFVAVSLADTGTGIAPDRLDHIFEPFYTTKEVGKGTGLGLSQVYGFAKQSGGDVAVESEVGRGTAFTLFLPRVERGEARVDPSPEPVGAAPAEHGRGRRVLVVEDNVEVGTFSTQILQDLGYETTWAANAEEALSRLDSGLPVDAVFSDVVMPGMGGVELGQEIRRRFPGLPVVLTSGYSHVLAEEGRHGFELLQKPYAAEELSRVLRRVTGSRTR